MKKPAVSVVLAAMALPAWSADAGVDRLVNCADIRDSGERLACFDREVAPLARARMASAPTPTSPPLAAVAAPRSVLPPAPTPAPAASPSASPPSSPASASTFGAEQLAKPRVADDEPAQVLHAKISALRAGASGSFVVTLDNGQAWRHEDQHQGSFLKVGEAITIQKGTLGSYRLTRDVGAARNWIRVTRIR